MKESIANYSWEISDLNFKPKNKLEEHTHEKHSEKEEITVSENNTTAVEKSDITKSDEKVFHCDECNYKWY